MKPRLVITLAIVIITIRLVLSGWLGFGDDEAYYWEWSRDLAWSYYDHPAMVAWLIKLGTLIFGVNEFGVRFFGLVCNGLSGYFLWRLARDMFDARIAWTSLFLYLFAPIFTIGGILMVPDAPLAAAWMCFTWLLWRLWGRLRSQEQGLKMWLVAGAVLGLGLISKYTMILLALSGVVLFVFSSRRRELIKPGFWTAVVTAFIFSLPIIFWNEQYDWPSLKFHLQDRQTGGGGANFSRWAQYFASQLVALGPALYLVTIGALVVAIKRSIRDERWRFLALVSLPPLGIFTAQALFAEFKPHWPAPAYPALFIGVACLWEETRNWIGWKKVFRLATVALVLFFIAFVNIVFHVAAVWPVVPKIARAVAPDQKWDPKFDPTNDLFGWDAVAERIENLRAERKTAGKEDFFVSSSRYQLVAQLAFALRANDEVVLRVSPNRDHYTFTQGEEVQKRIGKDSIFVTDHRFERDPRTDNVFESCTEIEPVQVYRGEELARLFHVWSCVGFRGLR